MRPILMSSSSSSSLQSAQQFHQSSNRNVNENNKNDNSHELNKNYNNDLNDNSRLGIYCTLRLPQQQNLQQQQQQQTINNDLILKDRKLLNCSTINRENLNSMIQNDHHYDHHNHHHNHHHHHNQQQYNINIDEDSDEDNLRLLDNTKKESSMLKQLKQIQNEDQHEFDLNDASFKISDGSSKDGGNFHEDKNYMIGGSRNHHDTDYNNGNKEIYCSTAFLRLKDNDKNLVELPYPVQDSSSSSDEQTTPSISTSNTEYSNRNPLDLLSYCTMSKKLKQMITPLSSSSNIFHHHNPNIICDLSSPSTSTINNLPYHKLKESEVDLIADELKNSNLQNYGLSNNLSTESLKNACDCYDLTDEDDDNNIENNKINNSNNYTNKKDFFINNNNSLKRRNSLKIVNNDKSSSNSSNNINYNSNNSKEQQLPNNKKTSLNNCLLQKLEHGLNELKKCEKNQQNSLKQKQNQLKNYIKSQSLDRKRNSSNHRTTITNQRLTNTNNLENNQQNQQQTTTTTTINNGHPSYCTMKRDRNINNSNFKFENNSIKLPTANHNLNISTTTTTTSITNPIDTTTLLTNTNNINNNKNTINDNQNNDNDNDQQNIDKYYYNSSDESSINLQPPSSQNNLHQYASLTTEAFNILNELDEILANTETAISRTASVSSSSSISTTNKLDFDFDNTNQNQDNNNLFLITNNVEVCNNSGGGSGSGGGGGGGGGGGDSDCSNGIGGGKISPIQSETTTEKIEDCLFELDEYLDEIDRQTPKLYRDSSEDDYLDDDDDYHHHHYKNIEWLNDDDYNEYCNQETLKRSKTLPKKLLRRQYLNDIHLNPNDNINEDGKNCYSIGIDGKNNKKFMTIDRKVELLQRGHILRNTIAGLRHKIAKVKLKQNNNNESIESKLISNTIQSSNLCDFTMNGGSQPGTPINSLRKAWRRNSMRKTSLINLPDNFQQNSLPLPFLPPPPPFPAPSQSTSSLLNNSNNNNSNRNIENNFNDLAINDQQTQINNLMDSFSNYNDKLKIISTTTTELETRHQNNHNSLPVDVHINSDIRRTISNNDEIQERPQQQLDNLNCLDLVHDIINNTTLQDSSNTINENENLGATGNTEDSNLIQQQRPRQIGRRAEAHPRILSITTETTDTGHRIIVNHDRPVSAPAAITSGRRHVQTIISPLSGVLPNSSTSNDATSRDRNTQDTSQQQQARFIGSEASSIGSSRNPSPVSIISSTGSSSLNSTNTENQTNSESHHRQQSTTAATTSSGTRTSPLDPDLTFQVQSATGINSYWPHSFSRILALLCCTLGLFNISRFSVQTVHYGGNFLIQFLILSIIFGIPMFWLQMCLGSKIRSGPVSMWKISPICRGIGISLCLAQCIIALYSTISLAWILVYFRDSFVKRDELYRWQEAFYIYRRQTINFTTTNLTETIADYFNGVVLQRWQLGLGRRIETGGVRFQLAFNLAIIWTLVFIILCKGLKSFGKLVISLTVIPLVLFFIVTCQLLYIIDFSSVQNIFSASDFEDFLINSKTWIAAAQETFLTWVLLSPSVISITSRSNEKDISKTVLRRDAIVVVLLTLFGLSLAAVFGYACIHILQNYDYFYIPGSYENMDSYLFLFNHKNQVSPILSSIPIKWIPHYSSVLGETYRRQSAASQLRESGYEPLRLCTELFPAVVAVAQDQISSVFTVLGFLAFLFFGLAQLCAIWKPISSALGNSSSSVLLSCVTGLLLGIPFATEMGLSIIHYLDLIIGGAWWLPILWTAQIFGVFLIRGRPYNGDLLVNDLKMAGSMSAFLALSWNVLLPIGLVSLSVIQYKVSGSNQFYYWRGKSYFNFWARKVGGLIQVGFLLIVPLTAIVQIYRYLNKGPPDILDRIQNLYRPSQSPLPSRRPRPTINRPTSGQSTTISSNGNNNGNINLDTQTIQDDAPPKYTPPPSYTTATGARLAKIFRQSIRRSVRRILGESSRTRPILHTSPTIENILPPEYSTVLTDPSGLNSNDNENIEIGPRVLYNSNTNRNISSIERQRRRFTDTNIEIINRNQAQNANNTILNRPNSAEQTTSSTTSTATRINNLLPFSASDVAQVLRTNRHERSASALATRVVDHALRSSSLRCKSSRSVENLVLNAAPLGESSAIALNYQNNDDNSSDNNRNNDERTSVI